MLNFKLISVAVLILSSQVTFAANVTCQVNTEGRLQATQAWRNTLGAEADRACGREQGRMDDAKQKEDATLVELRALRMQLNEISNKQTLAQSAAPGTETVISGTIALPKEPVPVFEVRSNDRTVREVLVRWATMVNWTHKPEHWTIDRDLPISGTDTALSFGTDFKEATRRLLKSTELTDVPLQPCFYSNFLLRVVPKAELCDKSK